jgi:hypothetical protein
MAPLFGVLAVVVGLRKWRARDGKRLPISAKVLHGPGEQLRQRIADIEDELGAGVAMLVMTGPVLLSVWALTKIDMSKVHVGFLEWFCLLFGAAIVGWQGRAIVVLGRERRRHLEGLIAEQFTAQELNRLMGLGCAVFHDVPADGFNIDHVVVGPSAIFAVETKSRRKPRVDASGQHFKVSFDGSELAFPDHRSDKPLIQCKRQAEWLAKHIQKSTARAVPVVPALALPGWWIDYGRTAAASPVKVFNPIGRGSKFMYEGSGPRLDEGTRALVSQSIAMLYPETPASMVFKDA